MSVVEPGARYLVTGGAGFIGSHLCEGLAAGGAKVRILDDFSTGRRENLDGFAEHVEIIEGCLTDFDTCRRACEDVDFVFHQAALPSVQRSVEDPLSTHAVDATGTLHVLVASKEAGVRRVVYAGSSSAYGNTPVLPKEEGMASSPRSPYAVAKLSGEHYCLVFADVMGLETVVLRYFNIFGPRQDPHSQYSAVIPLFITYALEGRSPTIHGDGGQTRDFTYVGNAVDANFLACHGPADHAVGQVFNVGCGDRISIDQLWSEIQQVTGARVDAVYGPERPGDVRDSLADLTRIRENLGYEPAVSLAEGLRRTCEWFRG